MEESIKCIDCNYIYPQLACAYMMMEGEEVAFVENNTAKAAPILYDELEKAGRKPEDVRFLIITHVHLDHAGGTSELLSRFPNATVLAHPRAAPHIINPNRLIQSAKMVYGEESFNELYGTIQVVDEKRVRIMQDGEVLKLGERNLSFIYTKGHANHHFVIHDSKTNGIFTGDSFGIAYPALQKGNSNFLFPTSTPTDFDPQEALLSVDKILETGADKAYLTHFGIWEDIEEGARQMKFALAEYSDILKEASSPDKVKEDEVDNFCLEKVYQFMEEEVLRREIKLNETEQELVGMDIKMNAMGIAYSAKRLRKRK